MLKRTSRILKVGLCTLAIAAGFTSEILAADQMPNTQAGKAYHGVMEKMNQDMMKGMTGDPDKDFVMMMIPHHQGAIDMAKVVIQHGKDAELKKMAQESIAKQEKEISEMKRWLDKHK